MTVKLKALNESVGVKDRSIQDLTASNKALRDSTKVLTNELQQKELAFAVMEDGLMEVKITRTKSLNYGCVDLDRYEYVQCFERNLRQPALSNSYAISIQYPLLEVEEASRSLRQSTAFRLLYMGLSAYTR